MLSPDDFATLRIILGAGIAFLASSFAIRIGVEVWPALSGALGY